MNMSEQIDQLATALSQFQGEVKDANKDIKGYNYTYADLSQVLQIVRPLMAKHGLALVQFPGSASDKVTVESILMHKSGQWMGSVIEMGVTIGKGMTLAQAVGSVITYARRYAVGAILGITQTDTDAAVEESRPPIQERKPPTHPKINEYQASHLLKVAPQDRLDNYLKTKNLERIEDISIHEYNVICDQIRLEGLSSSNKVLENMRGDVEDISKVA